MQFRVSSKQVQIGKQAGPILSMLAVADGVISAQAGNQFVDRTIFAQRLVPSLRGDDELA